MVVSRNPAYRAAQYNEAQEAHPAIINIVIRDYYRFNIFEKISIGLLFTPYLYSIPPPI